MPNVRNVTLNVAAVIVIVAGLLSLLTTLPQTLSGLGATPAPPAATTSSSAMGTTAISVTNATTPTAKPVPPRAGPNPLVIRGDKGPLLQVDWQEVKYSNAPLIVWSIDPTTLAPTDTITNFVVSWQPAASADNIVPLNVQRGGLACQDLKFPDSPHLPACYTVAVTRAATTGPGIYTSTLYIGDNAGTESTVTLKVLVGRSLWVLLMVVALGVIVTEAWLLWRKTSQYDLGWASRREEWLKNLSKDLKWTRPFEQPADAQQAERDVLQIVKTELRTAAGAISTWLEQGQASTLTLQDLPASEDAIQAKVDPLLEIARHYLKVPESLKQQLDAAIKGAQAELVGALGKVRTEAITIVESSRKESIDQLKKYYQNIVKKFDALSSKYGSQSPQDRALQEAWNAIQEMENRLAKLQRSAMALASAKPVSLADKIAAVQVVTDHLEFLGEVIAKAEEQQNAVGQITPNLNGKAETQAFLDAVINSSLANVKNSLQKACYPLKGQCAGGLFDAVASLQATIARVSCLQISNLSDPSCLRTELQTAMSKLSTWCQPDQADTLTWRDLLVGDDMLQAKVDPLAEAAQRYYEAIDPLKRELVELTKTLDAIRTSVVPAVENDRKDSVKLLIEIYRNNVKDETAQGKTIINQKYDELADKWKRQPSQDNKLLEAWGAVQEIWSQLLNLQQAAATLKSVTPISFADEVSAVHSVVNHLTVFNADVITKAQSQLKAISQTTAITPPTPGALPAQAASPLPSAQAETEAFLNAVTGLAPLVKSAEQPLQRAQQPLKYASSTGLLNAIRSLKQALKTLDDRVASLQVNNLNDVAVQSMLLATVQKGLKSIDDTLGDSTKNIAGLWPQIQVTHSGQARLMRIGRQILQIKDLVEKPQYADVRPQVMPYLYRAYRHLLNGRALDAEVAIERARGLSERDLHYKIFTTVRRWESRYEGMVQRIATKLSLPYGVIFAAILFVIGIPAGVVIVIGPIAIGVLAWLVISPLFAQQTLALQFLARFDWRSPVWYILIALLVIAAVLFVIRRLSPSLSTLGLISALISETTTLRMLTILGKIASGIVSLAIAVTIIVAAREATLKDGLSTWGTNLDILVAFTWGAVAHRLLQSLQSSWTSLQSFVQGDKSAVDTTKPAEGK